MRSRHAYGDVYSSPGISLRQKELLMCAYLGQANMSDQLFSHIYAVRLMALSFSPAAACSPGKM